MRKPSISVRPSLIVPIAAWLTLMVAAIPSATAAPWTGYATKLTPEQLVPFNTDTGETGTPLEFFNSPRDITISPDGKTAYLAMINPFRVLPVDLETRQEGTAFPLPAIANKLALSPGGSSIWVASTNLGEVRRIDLLTGQVYAPIKIGSQAWDLAITPDGASAYVTTGSSPSLPGSYAGVVKINLSGGTVSKVGETDAAMDGMGVLPDGSSAYAISSGLNRAYQVQNDALVNYFSAGSQAGDIAIAPDGSLGLAVNFALDQVTVLNLETNTTGVTIPVGDYPISVAITPDSKKAFVTNRDSEDIVPINLESLTAGTPIPAGHAVREIAITPNQPPEASFTVGAGEPGKPVTFDASASVDVDGRIASYTWDFGDGTSATGSSPNVTHTYTTEGTYTARLSLVDEIGCSTETVFTGQIASCGGNMDSVTTRKVDVSKPTPPSPPPPTPPPPPGPPGLEPALGKLKVTPKKRVLKRGRKVVFKARVKNTGSARATNLRICTQAPRRLIRVKKCVRRKVLAPGRAARVKFVVRAGKKARAGKRAKIRFRATARGLGIRKAAGLVRLR